MGSGFDCILHCRHSGLQLALQAFRPSMAIAPAIASCIAGIPAIHGHRACNCILHCRHSGHPWPSKRRAAFQAARE
jgi:hypothetical protein